ncbi:saccharopine dehydrogenase family protein [Psychrobacter phenylpyruvicus]|uniref:Trans-acting enoyl reductase Rv2449c n=1 Tax=Psychrobacter phenylpyruvicus TaxID=29432 RepID=A0A379LJ83_9GAMM|nr:saccharopine dehydrogenase NADP-binding domain-containing protein [Psychrobacter phenylpyruvicus]SUD89822.1 Putative trans-acting enoyl reductase Rv2449c [Psychrobacter phenylpyruvicus]
MTNENIKNSQHKYGIVLYGATSFVGQLVAEYLQKFLAADNTDNEVSWAIAGRNQQKLEQVKQQVGNTELPIIIADSEDADSLNKMAAQAQVIISTVGPYLKYGEPLIKACAENGTDYVDLTGEALFIKNMLDKYQQTAKDSGARIVNSCGFDSLPSDLGVLFTQNCAQKEYGEYCETINMRVKAAKGGVSGGTVSSMATIFEELGKDKSLRKQLANPYLLNDDENRPNVRQQNINLPQWDAENERWVAPFIMASINTRIVHRSNQLRDYQYGRDFKYDEAMWLPAGLKGRLMSYGMTAGIAGFAASMMFKPSRDLLNEHVLPKSGDGPSKSERENGYFDIRFFGYTNTNHEVLTKVTGDKDPGYGGTCQMLSQSALCLLQDISRQEVEGGFWTPAAAMGEALIKRLQDHAGIEFVELSA